MNWTLRNYRKAVGLSQRDLAEKMNCSQANISLYEKGLVAIQIEDVPLLAELFDATTGEIVEAAIATLKSAI